MPMNSLVKQREEKQDNSTSKGVVSNYYEFICELTITRFHLTNLSSMDFYFSGTIMLILWDISKNTMVANPIFT